MLKLNKRMFGIDIRNFTKGRKISSGGFGEVFQTQYQKTGESFAAKVIKRDPSKPQTKKLIENEVNIMMNIDHPTIIKFLGYSLCDFEFANNVTIFMQLAKNHSLEDVLNKVRSSEIPKGYNNTIRQIILIGIACGMKYLHQNGIIHRDLKPNNILLDENLFPLITDFGTSKYFNKRHPIETTHMCGTLPYMAPEMIAGSQCNYKIDIYSFGILMYEVVTHEEPYPHLEKKDSVLNEFKNRVVKFHYRPTFKEDIQYELKSLIEKCWSYDPMRRPNFDEIFDKLKNVDYFLDGVNQKEIQNYVTMITKDETEIKPLKENRFRKDRIESQEIDQLKRLNDQLKSDNNKLLEQINKLKEENKQLLTNNQEISKKLETVVKKLLLYENEETNHQDESAPHPCFIIPPSIEKKEDNSAPRSTPKYPISRQNKNDNENNKRYNDDSFSSRAPQRSIPTPIEKKEESPFFRSPPRPKTSRDRRDDLFMRSQIIKDKRDDNLFIRKPARRNSPQPGEKREKKEEDLFARSQIIKEKKDDDIFPKSSSPHQQQKQIHLQQSQPQIYLQQSQQQMQLQQNNEKLDDEILNKLPPLRKTKSDDTPIKSLSYIITIAEFNTYSLQLQRSFISKITSFGRGRMNQFFKNLDSLLLYILQFVNTAESTNFIEILSENPELTLDSVNDLDCVNLLSNATEILYYNKTLDSYEFTNILDQFENVSIEIKYLSKTYMGSYKIISSFESDHIKPNIFITGVKRTDNTFKGNGLIHSVKIDNSVNTIGDYAFKGCMSLKYVSIPSSVTSIGSGSFEGCTSLTQISIPSSVSTLNISLFKGCTSLETVYIEESVKLIRTSAFFGCSSLTKIEIPPTVTFIGDHAFDGCTSLPKISIPESVLSIGEAAFNKCKMLKEIFIPSSVASIGKNAFNKCSNLEKITLHSNLKNINELGIPSSTRIILINE